MKRRWIPITLVAGVLSAGAGLAAANPNHGGDAHKSGGAHAHASGQGHGNEGEIGVPGEPGKVARTVSVDMTDNMRFSPSSVPVKRGETIRFVVKNSGHIKHEFVLGTEKELKDHSEQMKKFPEMEHADPNMVSVAPGKTGEVVWRFTKAGKVDFACLQPGHYDAGMKGAVRVAGSTRAAKSEGHGAHKH